MFRPITQAPPIDDKCFINTAYGGYNKCIVIDKTTGSVIPNCTGFAYGAWMYSTGTTSCNLPTGDAGNWFRSASSAYKTGNTPEIGAVACWGGGVQGRGHVAMVNAVHADGSIDICESGYYSQIAFKTETLPKPYNMSGLTFQGFIYNPAVNADKIVINGGKQVYYCNDEPVYILGQREEWKLGMISAKGSDPHTALQKLNEIDDDRIVIYGSLNCNYFQMRHDVEGEPYGEHYGTEISLTNEFCPHKGNVLAYALRKGGDTICMPDSMFLYSAPEVDFACAPAYVPYLGGQKVNLWSNAFIGTKAVASQQSMLIRTKDRFAFAVCDGKQTVQQLTEWCEQNIDGLLDLCFLDSGGSSQLMTGHELTVYTGREIPNVLSFYMPKSDVSEPSDDDGQNPTDTLPDVPGNEPNDEEEHNMNGSPISNETYDRIKQLMTILGAIETVWLILAKTWNIPYGAEIGATIGAFITGLSYLMNDSSKKYWASMEANKDD